MRYAVASYGRVRLHSGFLDAHGPENDTVDKNALGNSSTELKLDVGGQLNIGVAGRADVVNVYFVLSAVQQKRHLAGLVGGIKITGLQRAVFDDRY